MSSGASATSNFDPSPMLGHYIPANLNQQQLGSYQPFSLSGSAVSHEVLSLLQTLNSGYGVSKHQLLSQLATDKWTSAEAAIDSMIRDQNVLVCDNRVVPSLPGHQILVHASAKSVLPPLLKLIVNKSNKTITLLKLWNMANWSLLSDYLGEITALDSAGLICFNPVFLTVTPTSLGLRLYHQYYKSKGRFFITTPSDTAYNKVDLRSIAITTLATLITTRSSITVHELGQSMMSELHPTLQSPGSSYGQLAAITKSVIKDTIKAGYVLASESRLSAFTMLALAHDRKYSDNDLNIIQCIYRNECNKLRLSTSRYTTTSYTAAVNSITSVIGYSDVAGILRQLQHLFQLPLLQNTYGQLMISAAAGSNIKLSRRTLNPTAIILPANSPMYFQEGTYYFDNQQLYTEGLQIPQNTNPFGDFTTFIQYYCFNSGQTYKMSAEKGRANYTYEIDYDNDTNNFIIRKLNPAGTMPDGYRNYNRSNPCGATLLTIEEGDLYGPPKMAAHFNQGFTSVVDFYPTYPAASISFESPLSDGVSKYLIQMTFYFSLILQINSIKYSTPIKSNTLQRYDPGMIQYSAPSNPGMIQHSAPSNPGIIQYHTPSNPGTTQYHTPSDPSTSLYSQLYYSPVQPNIPNTFGN